jgi:uncharacterized protein (DUF58 family)
MVVMVLLCGHRAGTVIAVPSTSNAKAMIRNILALLLVGTATFVAAQTRLQVTNLTITEKENVTQGVPITASLQGDQGRTPIVLFADQTYTLDGLFKVRTYNVKRQSEKQGAVYLTMTLYLSTGGKRNKHVVEKVFYVEQERSASFSEEFLIKNGLDVRKITVTFDGRID